MVECFVAIHAPDPPLHIYIVFSHKGFNVSLTNTHTYTHIQRSCFIIFNIALKIPNWWWNFKVIITNQSSNKKPGRGTHAYIQDEHLNIFVPSVHVSKNERD